MESTIDSMCRCCAAEGIFKDIKTSYHWMGEEEVYGDMLRECFDVKLASIDQGGICEVCITQLRNAANFKKQVVHTERKFKRHLDSRGFKPTEVKEELSGDNANSSDDDHVGGGDSEDDEDYVPEFEIPIKTESTEESKSRKRAAKASASTSRAKKSRAADGDKSVTFKTYKPVKAEIVESLTDKTLVELEDSSDYANEPATAQTRKLRTKTKHTSRKKQTPIHRIKLKRRIERLPANLTQSLKIKSLTLETGPKLIKIAPPLDRAPAMQEIEKHRYNIRTILLCSNATPIRGHYVGSGYICSFCNMHFLKAADLKTHTIHDHDDKTKNRFMKGVYLYKFAVNLDITSLKCNICSSVTDTLEQLVDHLNNIHQKGIYTDIKCYIACYKFVLGDVLKCYICLAEYTSFKSLCLHMNNHTNNFVCTECGASFLNLCKLSFHSKIHEVSSHKCGKCGKMYKSSHKLKSHMRQTHATVLQHKCRQCNERFKTRKSKMDHIKRTHGVVVPTDSKCDTCDRIFTNRSNLWTHIKRDHLLERRHQCDICDFKFFSQDLLKRHKVTHTGSRDFKCDICTKSYSRKSGLVEHMRSHNGDRRFKCTYCDMAFLQKCSLKGHLRSRHDAELYEVTECG